MASQRIQGATWPSTKELAFLLCLRLSAKTSQRKSPDTGKSSLFLCSCPADNTCGYDGNWDTAPQPETSSTFSITPNRQVLARDACYPCSLPAISSSTPWERRIWSLHSEQRPLKPNPFPFLRGSAQRLGLQKRSVYVNTPQDDRTQFSEGPQKAEHWWAQP